MATIRIADPVRPSSRDPSDSHSHNSVGGVYPIRELSRTRSRSREPRSHDQHERLDDHGDAAGGLRQAGDFKKRQV
jgi:hypothetical protein